MTMTAAIIDDLEEDRNLLKQYLLCCSSKRNLYLNMEEFCSSEQFLQKFIPGNYSIIFIDIYLNNHTREADGMELARKIRALDQTCIIIFSTTSPDFAIEGYKVRAAGYLLKPYGYQDVSELFHLLESTEDKINSFIEIKEKGTWRRIRTSDIIYVAYYNHYNYIYTKTYMSKTYLKFSKLKKC
ncbi:response regulator [Clostridium sp. AM58-1XD]|nr:response regulator [Clostridium sp. AM58-1XD]